MPRFLHAESQAVASGMNCCVTAWVVLGLRGLNWHILRSWTASKTVTVRNANKEADMSGPSVQA